jgi:hypothetical protein
MRAVSWVCVSAIAAFFVAFSPLAAQAQDAAPDFSQVCKKAVKHELKLDKKKEVKIQGKRTNGDGFTVLDFSVSDGQKGSCFLYKSGKLSEVKMQPGAAAPAPATKH